MAALAYNAVIYVRSGSVSEKRSHVVRKGLSNGREAEMEPRNLCVGCVYR